MPAKLGVEEVGHRPHIGRVPHSVVRKEPQCSLMISSRRYAADELRVGVRNDAWQNCNAKPRSDARQQASRCRMMHRNLALEAEQLQPGFVMKP